MEDVFRAIVELRDRGEAAALATIVDTKGSTPGKLGQRMLVRRDGSIVGTVGGGCLEADVLRAALHAMDTGVVRKLAFTLSGAEAERTGLACGGTLEIMVEALHEAQVIVVGLGHVGRRIALLAKEAGFVVTGLDDRPDFADPEKLAALDRVVCAPLAELPRELRVAPHTSLISVTRGHDHDFEVLRWALRTEARFIGIIGSRAKRIQFFRALEKEGVAAEELERVRCPVGLDIGARTPEEIAIAVVADLIRRRRRPEAEDA